MSRADRIPGEDKSLGRRQPWMFAAYGSFALALVAVLGIAGWGASVDFEEARVSLLREKVNSLRTHAVRSVLRIYEIINSEGETGSLDSPAVSRWLHTQWEGSIKGNPARLYAAVVAADGRVLVHYYRDLEGGRIDGKLAGIRVPAAGESVVETTDPRLTGGERSLDISIPIEHGDRVIGTYHSGFNYQRFEQELAEKRRETTIRWSITFLVISIVVMLAGFSLFQIAKRLSSLQGAVATGHVRRLADLGQLAGGIAHEIRNPLNAIRLNLHVIQKLSEARNDGEPEDAGVIEETVREIERVDGLLKTMLDYARPEQARQEIIDVAIELHSVVKFLAPLFERDRIEMALDVDAQPLRAKMDRGRLRQVLLNLLKNAMEAVGRDGNIRASLHREGASITLAIGDSGSGLPADVGDRIFDPFFSTKELGTGLGLTLVKRYVEEAGGSITARAGESRGAIFEVVLPTAEGAPTEIAPKSKPDAAFAAS